MLLNRKAILSEFFATAALVFVGTGAIVLNEISFGKVTHAGISFAFGAIVTLMILLFGKLSGAHMNPAMTIAFGIERSFPRQTVLPYLIAQTGGAVFASMVIYFTFGGASKTLGETLPRGSETESFFLELLLTLFLAFGVYLTAHKLWLVAITAGIIVGLEAFFAGPITGASMNPARSIGPALVHGNINSLWLYIIAPVAGAVSGVYFASLLRKKI